MRVQIRRYEFPFVGRRPSFSTEIPPPSLLHCIFLLLRECSGGQWAVRLMTTKPFRFNAHRRPICIAHNLDKAVANLLITHLCNAWLALFVHMNRLRRGRLWWTINVTYIKLEHDVCSRLPMCFYMQCNFTTPELGT